VAEIAPDAAVFQQFGPDGRKLFNDIRAMKRDDDPVLFPKSHGLFRNVPHLLCHDDGPRDDDDRDRELRQDERVPQDETPLFPAVRAGQGRERRERR